MPNKLYEVTRESNKAVTWVRTESENAAALRGATKLSIRGCGRKPDLAVASYRGSTRYFIYYWQTASNAYSNTYEPVYVSEVVRQKRAKG